MSSGPPSCCAGCKRSITEAFSLSEEEELRTSTKPRTTTKTDDDNVRQQKQQHPEVEEDLQLEEVVSDTTTSNQLNRHHRVADDLICPITLELPFDPVTADDGRVYERSAITKHIQMAKEDSQEEGGRQQLKSPLTNLPMGDKLLPAPQTKTLIQTLIDSGVISESELVNAWNEKIKEHKKMVDYLQKAENGVLWAMLHVGYNYTRGDKGFRQDKKLGFQWIKRAHEAGSIQATSRLGKLLLDGNGVEKDRTLGILYLSMAAVQGSNYAAYRLGESFAHGEDGLPVNIPEAIKWLRKCLDPACAIKDLHELNMGTAREMLEELENLAKRQSTSSS